MWLRKLQKGIWFFKVEIPKNVPPVKFTKCELVQFCVKVTIYHFMGCSTCRLFVGLWSCRIWNNEGLSLKNMSCILCGLGNIDSAWGNLFLTPLHKNQAQLRVQVELSYRGRGRLVQLCWLPSILYISASLTMSTSVLKALPGKLDIKRHSLSILYISFYGLFYL